MQYSYTYQKFWALQYIDEKLTIFILFNFYMKKVYLNILFKTMVNYKEMVNYILNICMVIYFIRSHMHNVSVNYGLATLAPNEKQTHLSKSVSLQHCKGRSMRSWLGNNGFITVQLKVLEMWMSFNIDISWVLA